MLALLRMIPLIVLVGAAVYLIFRFKEQISEFFGSPREKTDEEKLQEILDDQQRQLAGAQTAMNASAEYVRELQRYVDRSQEDINLLTARVKQAVADGDDALARDRITRLESEETKLAEALSRLEEAKAEHHAQQQFIDDFQRAIIRERQEARNLGIQDKLASARRSSASFLTDLKTSQDSSGVSTTKDSIQQRIRENTTAAKVDERLRTNKQDELKMKYAAKANSSSVESRLKEFKEQV